MVLLLLSHHEERCSLSLWPSFNFAVTRYRPAKGKNTSSLLLNMSRPIQCRSIRFQHPPINCSRRHHPALTYANFPL